MVLGNATGPIYRVLGPVEVVNPGGEQLAITPGRQEIILALLLLEANRVVSIEHMIDVIWADRPPATARTQVQICVSALRNRLAEGGLTDRIETRPPGYLMHVANGELDAQVFATMVAEASTAAREGRAAAASELLGEAVGLWRGPALSGLTSELLQARAAQMDESRLSAVESLIDAELRLGRHHEAIGDIGALVSEHPLRERFRGQLMVALYRSGRKSEALEVYRSGRATLVDQLGLEPGDELRRLEAAILADEVEPEPEPEPAERSTPEHVVAFQLPADITDFSGREALIEQVEDALLGGDGTAARVVVLSGPPGVGKSALAVHIAHRLESRFPDGQLYRDLGGARGEPATAMDVLGRFLRATGVPGAAIPETVGERAEMYRQLLARRRMVVVLDDAVTESQLRLLLPGSSSSAVIVTSQARLTGLGVARLVEVDVLDHDQAVALLSCIIGEKRIAEEPAAAAALIRLVGGLPLALRIVAARLAARPHWTLAWLLERLSDERRRLDELAYGELMVRASLAMSYNGLPSDARRLLRLLSVLDGMAFPSWIAAALLDTDLYQASDVLELLVDVQMLDFCGVDVNGAPRYRFHSLIRLFAREQLDLHEDQAERRAAVARVAGGWLALSDEAHRRLYGGDFTVLHGDASRWHPAASYVDAVLADPFAWLENEHANLCSAVRLAAAEGDDEVCWDLAVTLVTLFEARCYFDDWERTHHQALEAVRAAGNRRGEAALLCSLGSLQLSRGKPAEDLVGPALEAFERLDDVHGVAMATRNLALSDQLHGDGGRAAGRYRDALAAFREAGDPVGQAHVLGQLAQFDLDRGDVSAAGERLAEALDLCREAGSGRVETQLRYRLSVLLMHEERYAEAREVLADVLAKVREGRDMVGEGRVLLGLGVVNVRLGRDEEAERLLREAAGVRERISDHGGVAEVHLELARLRARAGDRDQAAELVTEAKRTFTERNMPASARVAEELLDSI